MTDEKIKEEFEEWIKGLTTEKEAAFANAINNPDQIDLAHGFYGGFISAERLAKIEALDKVCEVIDSLELPRRAINAMKRMRDELKACN